MQNEIEQMAKAVCHLDRTCDECMTGFECKAMMYAKRFYNAGYRKADEFAREIFEEIENALELLQRGVIEGRKNDSVKYQQLHDGRILSIEAMKYFTAELKKKYESEKDNG